MVLFCEAEDQDADEENEIDRILGVFIYVNLFSRMAPAFNKRKGSPSSWKYMYVAPFSKGLGGVSLLETVNLSVEEDHSPSPVLE